MKNMSAGANQEDLVGDRSMVSNVAVASVTGTNRAEDTGRRYIDANTDGNVV